MKNRKGSVFALAALASGLGLAGMAWAGSDDEKSPVHKSMETIQAKDAYIKKNYKTKAVFTKNKAEIVKSANDLVAAGKSVRDDAGPAKEQKKPQKEWTDLMDAYVKQAETYAAEVSKPDATAESAKEKYKPVIASCSACHAAFRKED